MGKAMRRQIRARVTDNIKIRKLKELLNKPNGRRFLSALITSHTLKYPLYVAELEGMADAAGMDVDDIWLSFLAQEFEYGMEVS